MSAGALAKNLIYYLKPIKEVVVMAPIIYYGLSKVQVVQKSEWFSNNVFLISWSLSTKNN